LGIEKEKLEKTQKKKKYWVYGKKNMVKTQ